MSQEEILKIINKDKILQIQDIIKQTDSNWRSAMHNLSKLLKNKEIGKIHHSGWITLYCSMDVMNELNGKKKEKN